MGELRVYLLNECLINPPPKPKVETAKGFEGLLGLFAPKLIEVAIGGVATLLKKAGDDETVTATGHDFTDLYVKPQGSTKLQMNGQARAILAIWGTFSDEDEEEPDKDDVALRKLIDAGYVPSKASIAVIFEAAIRPSDDETAFYLETRHFSVRKFIGERGKKERSYVATLALTTPNNTADGDTIAIGSVHFGRLKSGDYLQPADKGPSYRSNLMPWKQITDDSKAAYQADVAAGNKEERKYMPVSFNLTLSETADGIKFLKTLGELLEGSKEKAAEELSKLILPEERAKQRAARQEEYNKLYEAELSAEIEVANKKKELDAATSEADKAIKMAELNLAKRKLEQARNARMAAGLDPWTPPA